MRREEAISTLRSFLPAIQRDFGVRRISLFGSTARDEARDDSDLDLLVDFEVGPTFDSFMGRYKLSGNKYYGSDVVFGYHCAMGIVKNMETVYLGEYPLLNVDKPFAEF